MQICCADRGSLPARNRPKRSLSFVVGPTGPSRSTALGPIRRWHFYAGVVGAVRGELRPVVDDYTAPLTRTERCLISRPRKPNLVQARGAGRDCRAHRYMQRCQVTATPKLENAARKPAGWVDKVLLALLARELRVTQAAPHPCVPREFGRVADPCKCRGGLPPPRLL